MGSEQAINPIMNLLPYGLIFAVFYFLVIKPQKKEQKNRQAMLSDLKKNDKVVTSGGIHGTIVNIKDTIAIIRVSDDVKFEVDRSAILRIDKN